MAMTTCAICGYRYNKARQCSKCFPNPRRAEIKRMQEQGLRRCSKCQQTLPLSEFTARPERNTLRSTCKACDRASHKAWAKVTPEKQRKTAARKRAKHPDMIRVTRIRFRARSKGLPDMFTVADWQRAVNHWRGCCAYCGNQQGLLHYTHISAEHFIPLSSPDCPGTVPENILPICLSCNASRKRQDALTWLTKKFGKEHARTTLTNIAEYFASV